ncbi:MAG: methyltransferase domain-containing protein [Nevskiaceae bacterium]|nr:MAG: methyltransferase domain-containing protein [Nevskiaceae bacterium]TBR73538.1 MAG: methyltransferase domain-containing protein [Nevskiaceae bacterium]
MGRITFGADESDVEACAPRFPALVFAEQWIRHPLRMASIVPSGRQLAELVVDQLPAPCARVVELGAGTGAFTRILLARGIRPENLLVVEIDQRLAALLRTEFSRVRVACADARQLDRLVRKSDAFTAGELDAVVSGIGMLTMRQALRAEILRAAFAVLGNGGCFVQFTYGPVSPVGARTLAALGLQGRRAGIALRNFPPASVFVYRRA